VGRAALGKPQQRESPLLVVHAAAGPAPSQSNVPSVPSQLGQSTATLCSCSPLLGVASLSLSALFPSFGLALSLSLSRRKVFDGKWKGRLYGGKRNRIPHEVARNIMWPGGRNGPKRPSLPQERRPKQRGTPSLEISHSSPRLTFLTHNVDVGLDVVRVAHENREWRRNFKFRPNSNSFPKNILPLSFLLIAG
jgi:hypothetical protein